MQEKKALSTTHIHIYIYAKHTHIDNTTTIIATVLFQTHLS